MLESNLLTAIPGSDVRRPDLTTSTKQSNDVASERGPTFPDGAESAPTPGREGRSLAVRSLPLRARCDSEAGRCASKEHRAADYGDVPTLATSPTASESSRCAARENSTKRSSGRRRTDAT